MPTRTHRGNECNAPPTLPRAHARNTLRARRHVVRHPFKVLSSHYQHNWYKALNFRTCSQFERSCNASMEPTELSAEQALRVSDHLAGLGGMVCRLMTNVTVAMQQLDLGLASQVIRYVLQYLLIVAVIVAVTAAVSSACPPRVLCAEGGCVRCNAVCWLKHDLVDETRCCMCPC